MSYKILVINPGSTSTKISLFEDDKNVYTESLFHDAPELLKFPHVNDQTEFRTNVILSFLKEHNTDPSDIDVFVGRGGSAYSQPGGIIEIDDQLYTDTRAGVDGNNHPAKLGVMIAYELCKKYGGRMFTLNPTNVDELCDMARVTGIKGYYRQPQTHVLNQKGIAELHAEKLGKKYEDFNFIVCHIDGGITVTAHEKGRMIDGTMGAGGEGPFTPTRLGSLPLLEVCEYLEDGHTTHDLRVMMSRSAGFVSHFGTSNSDVIHQRIEEGDKHAALVWDTMCYQLCKSIGSMATVLKGKVDAILLTGGLVRFKDLVDFVKDRCGFIAPIETYVGEVEQEALAGAALKVMRGETEPHKYTGKPVFSGFDFIK